MTQPVKPILIGILLFFTLCLTSSCNNKPLTTQEIRSLLNSPQKSFKIQTPNGKEITLRLALTLQQKTQGLSGIMPEAFSKNEGMFFFYEKMGPRQFWMPNTYFRLHIIFMNEDLKVLNIEKNIPFHPGLTEPPMIPRTNTFLAQHVLEIKASSHLIKDIKVGDKLKWLGPLSLEEIKSNIHLLQ